jgi:uncharacterized protein YbjT (DUF2867 family)
MTQDHTFRPLRIAVAGATGRVGSALMALLATESVQLRALTRTPEAGRFGSQVELAAVDFDAPATLAAAFQGVNRAFIAHGTSPRQVANEIALIDAAVAAGVRHIVKLSTFGAPSRLHPMDWHMQIEAHLATQDIGYTVLRPSAFVDILARAGAAVAHDAWGGAAGDGRVNFIDTRDVADAAHVALMDHDHAQAQRAYHLTGPRGWSMPQVAVELSRLLERPVTYRHRSPEQQRATLIAAGASDFVAGLLLGLDTVFRDSALAETTRTFEELTGRAPRPVPRWLEENVALFRPA